MGLYVSGHPLDLHAERLLKFNTVEQVKKVYIGVDTTVAGILTEVKPLTTKKGDRMAFLKIADRTTSIEAVAFPEVYNTFREVLVADNCVVFKGKINERNGERSFLVDKVKEL